LKNEAIQLIQLYLVPVNNVFG